MSNNKVTLSSRRTGPNNEATRSIIVRDRVNEGPAPPPHNATQPKAPHHHPTTQRSPTPHPTDRDTDPDKNTDTDTAWA